MKSKIAISALILLVITIKMGVSDLNVSQGSTSGAQPQIMGHTTFLEKADSLTFFTVAGVVQNNLETNIKFVNVNATFYDAENNSIGTRVAPTVLKILKPKQRAPFQIYLLLNATTEAEDLSYELTLSYVETREKPIEGPVILNHTSGIDTNGYYLISGEVQNKGLTKAFSVKIFCTYYGAEGNLLAMSDAYVSSGIDVDEKLSFELSSQPHKISPASYELLVVTQRFELLIIKHWPLLLLLITVFLLFIIFMKRRGW